MVKCASECCVSERDVLISAWLSCEKNIQRHKRWIVCVMKDPVVMAWEGNEISDYMLYRVFQKDLNDFLMFL
jgi:hypothetical protein